VRGRYTHQEQVEINYQFYSFFINFRKNKLITMVTDFNIIEESALSLDESHRAKLAKRLLFSLEKEKMDQEIEQAWIEEVARRKKELQSGEVEPVSAEEVIANARELLQK
jgi:putative addiction module component (TIGR02574 family)